MKLKNIKAIQPMLTLIGIDAGEETAVTITRPAPPLQPQQEAIVITIPQETAVLRRFSKNVFPVSGAKSLQVLQPNKTDIEVAEILVGELLGNLVAELHVIERTANVILVDVYPYVRSSRADPVVPLPLVKTSWFFQLALRRFVMIVAEHNYAEDYSGTANRRRYYRRARFWARRLINSLPLAGPEREYFVYHILKTLNNPGRSVRELNLIY